MRGGGATEANGGKSIEVTDLFKGVAGNYVSAVGTYEAKDTGWNELAGDTYEA